MKITEFVVVSGMSKPDAVFAHTDLPDSFPGGSKLSIKFNTPVGEAETYLKRHFPNIKVTVNKVR